MLKMLTGIAAALVFSTLAAQATPINFSSTLTFSSLSSNKVTLTSSGLNTALNVGDPALVINDFITANIGNGAWSENEAITASFVFTTPTPSGTTTDAGFVLGGQVNGRNSNGTLSITWPSQPVLFNFLDGTILEVALGGIDLNCTGNNCLAGGPYDLSGRFRVLAGPTPGPTTTPVPEPLTLTVFAAGLAGLALAR